MIANTYNIDEKCCSISISHKGTICETFFDYHLLEEIKGYHWRISRKRNKFYVCTGQVRSGGIVYLHNFVLGFSPDGENEVDHIDGNELNNRCSNLRIVSRLFNIFNVSVRSDNKITGIRGVSYNSRVERYCVDFSFNGKRFYFKTFKLISHAAFIRYMCEVYFHGEMKNIANHDMLLNLIVDIEEEDFKSLRAYFKNVMLKYVERYGKEVITNVKNWNKVRRELDFPNRQFYGADAPVGSIEKCK